MKSKYYLFKTLVIIFITLSINACNQNISSKFENVLKVVTNGNINAFLTFINREGVLGKIKEYYVVTDKDSAGPFEKVDISSLLFTEDGKFLIWKAMINGKYFVFRNNEHFGPFDEVNDVEELANSKLKIEAEVDGKDYLYIEKKVFGPFDGYANGELRFDGNYIFYAKIDGVYYVFDSETNFKVGPFEHMPEIRKSYDNKTIYYEADYSGKTIIGLGNKIIGLDYKEILWPGFIPNSDSIYYNAEKDGFWYLFVGNRKFGPFQYASHLSFSSDGKIFAYSGQVNGDHYVYFKNRTFGPYENITYLTISSSGEKIAFISVENGKCFVNVDNEKAGPFDLAEYAIFSETGERFLYTTFSGENIGKLFKITGEYIHNKEETFGPYRDIFYWYFLPHGKSIAFDLTKQEGLKYRYNGKKEIGPFKDLHHPTNYPEDGTDLFAGNIEEHWAVYKGDKILGNYSNIDNLDYSEANKCIKIEAIFDNEWHSLIFLNNIGYIGSTWKNYRVFIKKGKIVIEKSERV